MTFQPPTAEELRAVDRLKAQLADEQRVRFTDTAYLRFLRGRKHDEEKALKALNRHLEWRDENSVDRIHENIVSFQTELDSQKVMVHGVDTQGRPSIFIYARRHNKNNRDLEQIRKLIIYTLEDTLKKSRPHEERILICFDLSGFSLSCMDYDAVKLLVEILQFNYPETLEAGIVINAPFIFWACWAIIRPWLDPVTVSKVNFAKKEELPKFFPPETLPKDI
jgi:uncharacterized protein YeeX (DUF496 family)